MNIYDKSISIKTNEHTFISSNIIAYEMGPIYEN